jgi:hypothetical protein
MGGQAFQISKEALTPEGFLLMEGKAVDRVHDDGDGSQFGGQTA